MPVKLPTKTPDAPADKPAENKFDPFRPEMPTIPGVGPSGRQAGRGTGGLDTQRLLQIGGIVAAVVLIGAVLFWWMKSRSHGEANSSSSDARSHGTGRAFSTAVKSHSGSSRRANLGRNDG